MRILKDGGVSAIYVKTIRERSRRRIWNTIKYYWKEDGNENLVWGGRGIKAKMKEEMLG